MAKTGKPASPRPAPFGRALKRARTARGMTQEALAEEAGLSTSIIANYEAGSRSPRHDSFRAIAKALDLSLDDLQNIVDEEEAAESSTSDQIAEMKAHQREQDARLDHLSKTLATLLDRLGADASPFLKARRVSENTTPRTQRRHA